MEKVRLSQEGQKTLADIIELKRDLAKVYMQMKELKSSARKVFERAYNSDSDYELGLYSDMCDSIEQMVYSLEIREEKIVADPEFYDLEFKGNVSKDLL